MSADLGDAYFEQAKNYNTAVVGIGYAGVFALLSYTHDSMTAWERAFTGASLLGSLTVFIVWVVFDMLMRTARSTPGRLYTAAWMLALLLTMTSAAAGAGMMFRAYWRMLLT